jgi:hypothetical protein
MGIKETLNDELKESHVIRDSFTSLFKNWKSLLLVILWTIMCLAAGYFVGSFTESSEGEEQTTAVVENE